MSHVDEIVTNIVLSLSNQLYEKQKSLLASRYLDDTSKELLKVPGLPSVVLSDVLPFHPLFVSSVKLDYTIDNEKITQAHSVREIRVCVEFKADKSNRL
jgi:hypothetical protein